MNLKNYKKKIKAYLQMDNEIIIFDDTEIVEHKFHQYKSSIWINGIDVNKIVVSNDFKYLKILNISLVTKIMKKLNLYAYSFQKRMHIE